MNILITGGASGLGEAIARLLLKNPNSKVYITYNNSEVIAKGLENSFSNIKTIKCSFEDLSEVNSLAEKIGQMDLDVIINNAYSSEPIKTHFHKVNPKEFSTDFMQNVLPTVILTQAAISAFRKKRNGKIITILTSFLHSIPPIGSSVYVANKAYLNSLVKSWAGENAKFNISSNSISPSFMQTNLTADVDERVVDQIREKHPLKKILTVEEAAEVVLFLVNASSQLNGIDIKIDSANS